ncbi:MAG: hypothetical protein PHP31_07615 [Lentimicrobiaceae bacterium]|nr:hypothetical protein [Lentimicrobiaceae bacterium]
MKNKTLIILIVVGLIVAYFVFFKPQTATAQTATATTPVNDLGTTASGQPITEAMITKEMRIIRNDATWFNKVRSDALQNGIEVATALRNAAIWQLKTQH